MRIGIEAQRVFRREKHGMDYVALELVRQIQALPPRGDEYFVLVAPGEDRCLSDTENVRVVELRCPTYPLWEQVALPLAARRLRLDLLHCTSDTAPLWRTAPLALTLHDIIFLEPEERGSRSLYQRLGRVYRRLVVPRVLPSARAVVTVSDYERDNIARRLPRVAARLERVYNGHNEWFRPVPEYMDTVRRWTPRGGYFFFLGNTDPKKNTARTLRAYARYLDASAERRPLLVADLPERELDRVLRREGIARIRESVTLTGYVDNAALPSLYSGALAFLYTSLRESFGIPILEAMACGCPVVTSRTSSMPEIGGGAALYADPLDERSISDAMLLVERDAEARARMARLGLERAERFTWRATAEQLVALYRRVGCAR